MGTGWPILGPAAKKGQGEQGWTVADENRRQGRPRLGPSGAAGRGRRWVGVSPGGTGEGPGRGRWRLG